MGDVSTQYSEVDISPRLWTNGVIPVSEEFTSLLKRGFSDYKLRVDRLVEKPGEFSYAQIKAMPKQQQITCHFCVQGWSGVAKWAGVPMRHILDLVTPKPEARYVVLRGTSCSTPLPRAAKVGATTTCIAFRTCDMSSRCSHTR